MTRILLLYQTTDGHTRTICERIAGAMPEKTAVTLTNLDAIDQAVDTLLSSQDVVVIGASIRYGKHRPQVAAFLSTYREILEKKKTALFSVSIVARKPTRNKPENNPYLQKLLRQIGWHPELLAVFAGKLDYPRYRFFDSLMIRLIMKLTDGPTDPGGTYEFTDWQQVEAFAASIAKRVAMPGSQEIA